MLNKILKRKPAESGPKVKYKGKKIIVNNENDLKAMVEKRAFEIFTERGCVHGNHDGDWYCAEKEIFKNVILKSKSISKIKGVSIP